MTRRRKGDNQERRDCNDAQLSIVQKVFKYPVGHEEELEIDMTPGYRYNYTYHQECNTPQTAHVLDRIKTITPVPRMLKKKCCGYWKLQGRSLFLEWSPVGQWMFQAMCDCNLTAKSIIDKVDTATPVPPMPKRKCSGYSSYKGRAYS